MEKQKSQKSIEADQNNHSIMSKNVTQFKHFLCQSHITEKDIDWAINLRNYKTPQKINKTQSIPQVYYKHTKLQQFRKLAKNNQNKNTFNSGQFSHLTSKKGSKKYPQAQIYFHTNLGNGSIKNTTNSQGYKFNCLAKKQRKQYPVFLKKETLTKTSNISKQDTETAFDGHQNFPAYSQKILKNKNIINFQYLVKGKVNLPNIAWHINLRNYNN